MSPSASEPTRPPTIRVIAKAVGMSPITVSLALRDHPSTAASTRKKVQQAAAKLGYRPDPLIAKLMTHLRSQRAKRLQAAMCCLTTFAKIEAERYPYAIFQGAKQRAAELGYSMDLLDVGAQANGTPGRLERILLARGVQGILLLPMAQSGELRAIANWKHFSVVCSTLSVTEPVTHRVLPNAFDNLLELCRELRSRGHAKLGLVITKEHDLRVGHRFTAVMAWHNRYGGSPPVEPLVPKKTIGAEFLNWYQREKPDAIIGYSEHELVEIEKLLPQRDRRRVLLVSTSKATAEEKLDFPGIDERPSEIGRASADLLASLIQHGDRGLPSVPRVTMITGAFHEGRPKPSRSRNERRPAGLIL